MSLNDYLLCFFIYSFLGYLCEVVYCSVAQRKLVNRGYLYMPICPIYGCGAVLIILSMKPLYDRGMWYLVLILGILLTSTLEYLTSYVMEICFHMRWWDYSQRKFNIHGRVCLRNSLMFGGLVMLVMYGIQPYLKSWIDMIPSLALYIVNGILLMALLIDSIFSTIQHVNVSKILSKVASFMDEASEIIAEKTEAAKEYLSSSAVVVKLKSLANRYPTMKLRKVGKKRTSLKEFMEKHMEHKGE